MPQAPAIYIQRQDNSTEAAGQRLRRARERLNLKFRDVEQASLLIAERRGNPEFGVLISRLSDIENQIPTSTADAMFLKNSTKR